VVSTVPTAATLQATDGVSQFCLPQTYHSDDLTELRAWLENRVPEPPLPVERTLYQENWDNVQVGVLRPG